MYFRSALVNLLIDEFDTDANFTDGAVDKFLEKLGDPSRNDYPSVILEETDDDVAVEGDLEEDAEHVYSRQEYWSTDAFVSSSAYVPARKTEVVELPNEDKLLEEDGER